jgi:hypothetical protein
METSSRNPGLAVLLWLIAATMGYVSVTRLHGWQSFAGGVVCGACIVLGSLKISS